MAHNQAQGARAKSPADIGVSRMSALGQKQTCAVQNGMSALPLKADMCGATRDVRFVPEADMHRRKSRGFPSKEPGRLGRVLALVCQLKANQS